VSEQMTLEDRGNPYITQKKEKNVGCGCRGEGQRGEGGDGRITTVPQGARFITRSKGDISDKVVWGGFAMAAATAILGFIDTTYGIPAPEGADVYLAGFIVLAAGEVTAYIKKERV
jgi:hypothetical protein